MLTSIAELGLPTAFTYLAASGRESARKLAGCVLPLVALQCGVLFAAGIPIVLLVLAGYPASTRTTAVAFFLIYAPLYLSVRFLMALSQGEGRIGVYNFARLLIPAMNTAALVALLAAHSVSVQSFAAAYAGSWVIGLVALLGASSRDTRVGTLSPRIDRSTAGMAWSVGRRTFAGSLAPIDTLQLDVLLTTSMLGATEAGLYYVATSVGGLVRVWGITFGALSLPRVASAATREDALVMARLFVRMSVVCSGLAAIIALAFARPLLGLVYGAEFTPAATLVRILAVGMFAASIRYVLGDGLRGLGKHGSAARAEIVGWLAGGCALAVFLPLWGVTGVALAVSVSYGVTLLAMLQSARNLGMSSFQLLVPTKADAARAWSELGSVMHAIRDWRQ